MDDAWLAGLRTAFESAIAQGKRQGAHVHLDSYDPAFVGVYTHPKVLAAVLQVLQQPFKAGPIVGRDPVPGQGQQALHADGLTRMVTTLWLLDDFTLDNGATRLVPGSHHVPKSLPKGMLQPESRHPAEQQIIAWAGSVLVFHSQLLHSGTRNRSGTRRRVLQGVYAPRAESPQEEGASLDIPERFGRAARYLLSDK
jgi:hypothetical protein